MKSAALAAWVSLLLFAGSSAPVWSQSPEEVYSFAQSLKRDRLYEAAAEQFVKFAVENPTDTRAPRALEEGAYCYRKAGRLAQAVQVLENLVATYIKDPRRCENEAALGKLYHEAKRFEDAERLFAQMIYAEEDCPNRAQALLGRAEALLSLDRQAEAVPILRNLVTRYHDARISPKAYYDLALALAKTGDREEALATLKKLTSEFSRHPLSAFSSLELARMLKEEGDTLGALDAYRSARRFRERAIFLPSTLEGARLLEAMGRHKEAARWYEKATEKNPLVEAFAGLARCQYRLGRYRRVEQTVRHFSETFPDSSSCELALYAAAAALARGRYGEALEMARRLERSAPGSKQARRVPDLEARALLALGRPLQALGQLRRYYSLLDDREQKLDVLARIARVYLDQIADTAAAVAVLEERLEVEENPGPSDMLSLALLCEGAGLIAKARSLYGRLADEFPFSAEATRGAERARALEMFTVVDRKAALAAMDSVALVATRLSPPASLLLVARARMEVAKDYAGALEVLSLPELSRERGGEVGYLRGSCWAALAERARLHGDEDSARDYGERCLAAWKEVERIGRAGSWAARAAFASLDFKRRTGARLDTTDVLRTISKYPSSPARTQGFEILGNLLLRAGRRDNLPRAIYYYRKALSVPAGDGGARGSLHLKLARALFDAGKWEEARREAESSMRAPTRAERLEAAYIAGTSLKKLKKPGAAVPLLRKVVEGDRWGPLGRDAFVELVDCLYMSADFAGALAQADRGREHSSDPAFLWRLDYRRGLCLERLGREEEALATFLSCLDRPYGGGNRAFVFRHAASLAARRGRVATAGEVARRFAGEFTKGTRALEARAMLADWIFTWGGEDEGEAVVKEIVELARPEDEKFALAYQAMVLYGKGDIAGASSLTTRLAAGDLDPVLGWKLELARARALSKKGLLRESAENFRRLASSCPEGAPCPWALLGAVEAFLEAKRVDEARAELERLASLCPRCGTTERAQLRLGNFLAGQGLYAGAVGYLAEAARCPDRLIASHALENLAVCYEKLSRWEKAAETWAELSERFPDAPKAAEARLSAARCTMEAGDPNGAISAYRRALPYLDDEGRARAYFWSGDCYGRMGRYDAAVVEYLKVPYLVPEEPLWAVTARLKAAEAYGKLGKASEARKIYQEVLKKYGPGSNWGRIATQALKEISGGAGE